jgi:hypothetical protein
MILDQLPNVSEAFRQTYEIATNIATSTPVKGVALGIAMGVPLTLLYSAMVYVGNLESESAEQIARRDRRRRREAGQRAAARSTKVRGALRTLASFIP